MGLLMIGGWGSFFGGGYRGTVIEDLLPVEIKGSDDRINCSSGLRLYPCGGDPVLKGLPFERGPVICGLNEVKPRRGAKTLAKCYPLLFGKTREVALANKGFPALILDDSGPARRGVLATDLAPHWAGGLLDWGKKRVRVRVPGRTFSIEVGDAYIRLIGNLIGWFLDENQSLRPRPGRIK
jgi:uncharacterized membrane protein